MKQPTNRIEAWIAQTNEQKGYGQLPVKLPTGSNSPQTPASKTSSGKLTPHDQIRQQILDRPRSTPPSLKPTPENASYLSQPSSHSRPATAQATYNRKECDRLQQVEHEATRTHNLDSHFNIRKAKPPPWQQKLDGTTRDTVVSPGYKLTRSKSKISVTIRSDELFTPETPVEKMRVDPERDTLIAELQQQVDDLTLYLEEEKLNHKETKRRAAATLKEKIDEVTTEFEDQIAQIEKFHQSEIEKGKLEQKVQLADQASMFETQMSKMRGELEYLHGAFETYRSQLHSEMDEKWNKREADIQKKYQDQFAQQIVDMHGVDNDYHNVTEDGTDLIAERMTERTQLIKEHQKTVEMMRKDHKREFDALTKRFSNAAADVERLTHAQTKLEDTEEELEILKAQYSDTCRQVTSLTRDLTDTKVQLMGYEHNFQDKVQEVDDKYKNQIHQLMQQNTELRQQYVKKCGELYDEKAVTEKARVEELDTAKGTMKMLIQTRNRALINMAATDADFDKYLRPPKERPVSAPHTKQETDAALLSANETDRYVMKHLPAKNVTKPPILAIIQQEHEAEDKEEEQKQQRIDSSQTNTEMPSGSQPHQTIDDQDVEAMQE